MATSLTARFVSTLTGTYGKTNSYGGDPTISIPDSLNLNTSFANGSGANQVNRYVTKSGMATDTPAAALDLSGTSADQFGTTTDLTKVRMLIVKNTDAANKLIVGGESADLVWLTDPITLLPGETLIRHVPTSTAAAVTATTKDKISVAAETGLTATYEMMVLGSA